MESKLGQDAAFATSTESADGMYSVHQEGMSKRFYAACSAMQGYLSNNDYVAKYTYARIVEDSYLIADELLKQENNGS